jgi:flagellar protein FliO/FliZ
MTGAGSSYGDLLLTSLLVLGLVCIVAFLVVRVVGRVLTTGRSRGAHLLDVVARLPLEPRRALYVVDVAGKTLLVGTSEMGLSVLTELDGAVVRARAAARPAFGELVRAAWQRRFARKASTGDSVETRDDKASDARDGGGGGEAT